MFWVLSLAFWVLDFALVRASARITQDSKPKTLNSQAGRPSRFLGDPAGGLLVEQSQVLMNCVHNAAQVASAMFLATPSNNCSMSSSRPVVSVPIRAISCNELSRID